MTDTHKELMALADEMEQVANAAPLIVNNMALAIVKQAPYEWAKCLRALASRRGEDARDAAIEGGYRVSRAGLIFNADGQRVQPYNRGGYDSVCLWQNGVMHERFVHRVVAEAFCTRHDPNQTQVNHRDGDKKNNCAANLEWCSAKENCLHSQRILRSQSKPIYGIDVVTGARLDFPSMAEAAEHGFKPANIDKCFKGLRKSHGGFRWYRADAAMREGGG